MILMNVCPVPSRRKNIDLIGVSLLISCHSGSILWMPYHHALLIGGQGVSIV